MPSFLATNPTGTSGGRSRCCEQRASFNQPSHNSDLDRSSPNGEKAHPCRNTLSRRTEDTPRCLPMGSFGTGGGGRPKPVTYAIVVKCAATLLILVLHAPTVVWTVSSAKSPHGQSKGMTTRPLNNISLTDVPRYRFACFIDTVLHLGNVGRKKMVLPVLICLKQ
jgi:hypothetical protein